MRLLAGLSCAAYAQEPVYGVTLGNVQAVRDVNQNLSAITGLLANQSARPITGVLLTFVLYDEQGKEIGRVRDDVPGPWRPGRSSRSGPSRPCNSLASPRWTSARARPADGPARRKKTLIPSGFSGGDARASMGKSGMPTR